MAQGFEGYISFMEQYEGYGDETVNSLFHFVEPESESLGWNVNEMRRDSKIRGRRALRLDDVSYDWVAPSGGVTLQPRAMELAHLLMSHFQSVRPHGTSNSGGTWQGTLQFAPVDATPSFSGSQWGTFTLTSGQGYVHTVKDVYPLRITKFLGSVANVGANDAAFNFLHGYVESMNFSVDFESDLIVEAGFNFRGTVPSQTFLVNADPTTSFETAGSTRFSGWNGTITWDGTANSNLDIEDWSLTTAAGGEPRGRIGNYGPQRFPFVTPPAYEGNFTLEWKAAKQYRRHLSGTGTFSMVMRFETDAKNWVEFQMPHCKFKELTPVLAGADQRIDTPWAYEAYGSAGTPAVIITLYTAYGTDNSSLANGSGDSKTW